MFPPLDSRLPSVRGSRRPRAFRPLRYATSALAATTLAAGLVLSAPLAASDFAAPIEAAHGAQTWHQHAAIQADIAVEFGGQKMLSGSMLFDTPGGKVRMELEEGTVIVFDGQDAWVSPADSAFQGARFHILTWPYFLAAPMKLTDPGTHLETLEALPLQPGAPQPAAKLTFDSGVGDSPDDWYILYRDSATGQLDGMAYIVTFGKDLQAAEAEPHAIVYGDYASVDGVALSRDWLFYNWSRDGGISGDPIGHVQLENLRFVEPAADAFVRPESSRREDAPPQ